MLNILVPTDFSSLSKVAAVYALRIAEELRSNVTLLHVINVPKASRASMNGKLKALEQDMLRVAERDLYKLAKDVCRKAASTIDIQRVIVQHYDFTNAIRKETKRLKTNLVVMGTKGASGLKKTMLGSNTSAVIESIDIPVLVVPDKAKFKGFREIVYASDLQDLEKEIKTLKVYTKPFGSTLHTVHVTSKGNQLEMLEDKMDKTIRKLRYKDVVSFVTVDDDIESAVDHYIGITKADCLTMFTHRLTFFEKLFDKSYTRKMAFHSKVPLLAFKKGKS